MTNYKIKLEDILKYRNSNHPDVTIDKLTKLAQEMITEREFNEIVGTVYKWTKESNDKLISEENIVQELDEKMLQTLNLLGNVQITNSKQIEYLSQFMDSDIDLNEYDYFFEYYE